MTLQHLLKIGRLKAHEPTAAEVQSLLAAIKRNLSDAAATNDYTGPPITAAAVTEYLAQARALEGAPLAHLRAGRAHLLVSTL